MVEKNTQYKLIEPYPMKYADNKYSKTFTIRNLEKEWSP